MEFGRLQTSITDIIKNITSTTLFANLLHAIYPQNLFTKRKNKEIPKL
jgi:hypothetical protein